MPENKVAIGKLIFKETIRVTCPYCEHYWDEPWKKGERGSRTSALCPNCGNGMTIIRPEGVA